jgi:hypothetical protein
VHTLLVTRVQQACQEISPPLPPVRQNPGPKRDIEQCDPVSKSPRTFAKGSNALKDDLYGGWYV